MQKLLLSKFYWSIYKQFYGGNRHFERLKMLRKPTFLSLGYNNQELAESQYF